MSIDAHVVDRVVAFHGHMCPGLAMGIRAAEAALAEVGAHSGDEEVVAIVETDMCGVDAVQFLTGCTFGKGNLIHRDYGKNAYTFVRRSDGYAARISARPSAWGQLDADGVDLFARVKAGTASPDERQRFAARQAERSTRILESPLGELYDVEEVEVAVPPAARVLASVTCSVCGEQTMETRIRRLHGQELCLPCFDTALSSAAPARAPRQQTTVQPTTCSCSTQPAQAH